MKAFPGKKIAALTTLVILVGSLIAPAMAAADEAFLKNIVITNTRDDLITYFEVEGAFTGKIKEAVLNGVTTTFSFFVSIYKKQEPGFDTKISDLKISSTLKYNSLKEEFTVSRLWKTEKQTITKSFEEAKSMMTEIDNLRVVSLDSLKKGENYQVRIKAELNRVTLPLYLHYILFFVSLWDFETDWHTIDFIY